LFKEAKYLKICNTFPTACRFARAVTLNTTRSQDFLTVGAGYSGHNQMLHDFGLPERDSYSEAKVRA